MTQAERIAEIREHLKEANAKGMGYWTYDDETQAITDLLGMIDSAQESCRLIYEKGLDDSECMAAHEIGTKLGLNLNG